MMSLFRYFAQSRPHRLGAAVVGLAGLLVCLVYSPGSNPRSWGSLGRTAWATTDIEVVEFPELPPGPEVDAVLEHVRVLTQEIGPRPAGSQAAGKAAAYIQEQLQAMGLTPQVRQVGELTQRAIGIGSMQLFTERRAVFTDSNIWVRIDPWTARGPAAQGSQGSQAAPTPPPHATAPILIMAHYDSVSTSPGAIDNAVSVGLLLELARILSEREPPVRPVILAFTAAEEQRLAGAQALAQILAPELGLAVSLDLIGSSGELTLNGLSSRMGTEWLRWLERVAAYADVSLAAPITHRVISRHLPQLERSDHGEFTLRGVPAFHLYHRDPGALLLAYHTSFDTQAIVDERSVADTGALLMALVLMTEPLPAAGGDQGFWIDRLFLPGWVAWALELAGIAIAVLALRRLWRARSQESGLGLLYIAGAYVLAWLIAALLVHVRGAMLGHPMFWVHAPWRAVLATALAGVSALILQLALLARWRPLAGSQRYLAAAVLPGMLLGALALAARTPELAWLFVLPAAALGGLAWARRRAAMLALVLTALLPVAFMLHPYLAREAVFHGFWGPSIPLAALHAVLLWPPALAVVYLKTRLSGRNARSSTLSVLVSVLAASVLLVVSVLLLTLAPPCSGPSFASQGLACELQPGAADPP